MQINDQNKMTAHKDVKRTITK